VIKKQGVMYMAGKMWQRCEKCQKWIKTPIPVKDEKKCKCGA
jgi:hypothetical protein